jgi:lipoate-protein ligase A
LWFILDSGPGLAPFNMAWDEALLESSGSLGTPVLRLYGWTEPAATFGYSQSHAEIARATRLRPLIRRPTGGGLVPHDADWTYSIIVPPRHAWYSLRAEQSYERAHRWVQASFSRLGIETQLAPDRRKEPSGQCFTGYEKGDVLWHGRKIAGAAQRRNKLGLLIQGSVQPPPVVAPTREAWTAAMFAAGTADFAVTWQRLSPGETLRRRVVALVELKYARAAFNERR